MSTTNMKCAGCRKVVPRREHIKCLTCKEVYDLECANLSSKLFNLMERKEWKCPECLSKKPKMGNCDTPVHNATAMPSAPVSPTVIPSDTHGKADKGIATRQAKQSRATSPPQKQPVTLEDLKAYMAEIIQDNMLSIREAISDLTNTIRDQNKHIEQLEARVTLLENKSEIEQPHNISELEHTIVNLKADIADRDQTLLSNDIEISGCPEASNENCVHIVLSIASKIGLDLDEKDIVSAHRAGPASVTSAAEANGERARPRPLAVKLARRAPRDAMLRAVRVRRNLTTEGLQLPGPIIPVYINERLTKSNRLLFWKARGLARERQYRYVWTRDGKIFVCHGPGKPKHRIRNEEDLDRVFT